VSNPKSLDADLGDGDMISALGETPGDDVVAAGAVASDASAACTAGFAFDFDFFPLLLYPLPEVCDARGTEEGIDSALVLLLAVIIDAPGSYLSKMKGSFYFITGLVTCTLCVVAQQSASARLSLPVRLTRGYNLVSPFPRLPKLTSHHYFPLPVIS
jgi:hypothetical protein